MSEEKKVQEEMEKQEAVQEEPSETEVNQRQKKRHRRCRYIKR